jgi:hypothetical protein
VAWAVPLSSSTPAANAADPTAALAARRTPVRGARWSSRRSPLGGASVLLGLIVCAPCDQDDKSASENAQVKIVTSMGSGRNYISVLTSQVIVIVGMTAGTASEVALALKSKKKVILLNQDEITIRFFKNLGSYNVLVCKTLEETMRQIRDYVAMNKIKV